MTVKVKANFKKDQKEFNGLDHPDVVKALVESPLDRHYVVALVETSKIEQDVEAGGIKVPTIRVVAVEPVDGQDAIVLKEMLDKRFKRRTGRDSQPTLFDRDDSTGDDPQAAGDILAGQIPFLSPDKAKGAEPEEDDTDHEALAEVGGPDDEGDPEPGSEKPWPGDVDFREPASAGSAS